MGLRRTVDPCPRLWIPAETMIEPPVDVDRMKAVRRVEMKNPPAMSRGVPKRKFGDHFTVTR